MKQLLSNIIGQRLMMVAITLVAVVFCPMPGFGDTKGWVAVARWRRCSSNQDACLGKYTWRPILAWAFAERFGEAWGEHIAQSQSPFAAVTGLFRAWRGKEPPA